MNAAGRSSGSTNFRLTGTLANEPASGSSASPAFLLQSGFWAFVGQLSVPIVLRVDRTDLVSQKCDLQWSGNSAPYEIFVADNCTNVFDDLYTTSSQNSLFGVTTLSSGLTCFNVVSMNP